MIRKAGWIARRTAIFVLSFALLSCATTQEETGNTINSLIPVDKIVTPDNGKRALIIAQDVRFTLMQQMVQHYKDGKIPIEYIDQFRGVDNIFRIVWERAQGALHAWELTGERKDEFDRTYKELLRVAVELNTKERYANGSVQN
jgi:hypothetical protein